MTWSSKTASLWKAFTSAVMSRDKSQFELYVKFRKSQLIDEKTKQEEEQLEF